FLGGAVGVGEGGLALPVLLGGSADEGQLCGALAEVDAESLPLGSNVVRFTWFDLRQMVGQVGLTDGEFFCLHETAVGELVAEVAVAPAIAVRTCLVQVADAGVVERSGEGVLAVHTHLGGS